MINERQQTAYLSGFFTERNFAILLLALTGLLYFFLAAGSESNEGGADAIEHYFISRYSFSHPDKFFDLWGKPVFTFLSAPFSQFGILGTKTYNIFAAILSAFICYIVAKKLRLRYSVFVIIFLCFSPMYFMVSISALTEVTFGMVAILAAYFFMDGKYLTGATIVSFLPFARQEGIFIILLFLTVLLIRKKYKAIPFLTVGFIFFSIAGMLAGKSFWWIVIEENLMNAGGVYGSGDLFHFVNSYRPIMGNVLAIIFLFGLVRILVKMLMKNKKHPPLLLEEVVLIYGVFIMLVAGHSYAWWKGVNGSLGLTRVIAGGLPFAAIICLEGFNLVLPILDLNRAVKVLLISALLILIFIAPFRQNNIPIPFNDDAKLMKEACGWIKDAGYASHVICYYDPLVCYFLDKDKYNREEAIDRIINPGKPEQELQSNVVVVWDAHFGPNEGGLPLQNLTGNPHFKLLSAFIPEHSFKTLNDYDYEIYVFLRRDTNVTTAR